MARLANRLFPAAFLLGLLVTSAGLAAQQLGQPGLAEAEEAIEQLRSPYCPGFSLKTCTSPQAGLLRDSIYMLAAQGATSEELVEWMLANHGEEYRAMPLASGPGLWAWVIPPLALLTAATLLFFWFRGNRTGEARPAPVAASKLSDKDREELAKALRDWESSGEEEG